VQITGAKYNDDHFLQPERYFSHYPRDPDNDAMGEDETEPPSVAQEDEGHGSQLGSSKGKTNNSTK
jgi:hypothetical protein